PAELAEGDCVIDGPLAGRLQDRAVRRQTGRADVGTVSAGKGRRDDRLARVAQGEPERVGGGIGAFTGSVNVVAADRRREAANGVVEGTGGRVEGVGVDVVVGR